MANQFEASGSQSERPHKAVPLAISQLFTGYWPNSAPYRDAAVPYLYAKFYGATRNDKITLGLNTEISPQLTLIRRPGLTVWNSFNWTNVLNFYAFTPFVAGTGEQVYTMVDTATGVYIASINSGVIPLQTLIYTKAAGAGTSRFQGEGNTLYWGDGVSTKKWSWFPSWATATSYSVNQCILDANNNIQQCLGYAVQVASTSVSGNIATINYTGTGVIKQGDIVSGIGFTTKTGFNNASMVVLTATTGSFTVAYNTGNYGTTVDTGLIIDVTQTAIISDGSTPGFSGTVGSLVLDGTAGWISRGNSVQDMGIIAPTVAPTVTATAVTAADLWAANTYYWPTPVIVDSNSGTGPWVWVLTTSGTTNGSVPSGLTTGTPTPQYSGGVVNPSPTTVTDGTAVWTCNSKAARQTSTAYSVGQIILATWSYTYYTQQYVGNPPNGHLEQVPHTVTYIGMFQCTTAGTTSSAATGTLSWNAALGTTVNDGTVVWTSIGAEVNRTASATSAPVTGLTPGNVSNSVLVSIDTVIQDANGNGEKPAVAGLSAGAAPTWATNLGSYTTESGGPTWVNQGPLGKANTGPWFYSYTYVNPATNDESTGSPLSLPFTLPATSGATISGPGSSDTQVQAINIYRTPQQAPGATSGTPFFLAQIPAPAAGHSWSYTDLTPDPPNPGAILNVFITCPGYGIVNGIVSNYNDPPPTGLTNFSFHAGRMWGTVGNLSYYSTGPDVTSGNGNTSWSVLNFNETPGTIFRLWPTTVGMFHFTNDGLWIVQGSGTVNSPFVPIQQVDGAISIASTDAFCINGTQALVYTSDRIYLQIDPQQGTSWLGQPVATDLITSYDPTKTFLTFHSNGLDQKGFITDGSNNWLSWEQVPAPETGYLWNPPATTSVAGGIKCVASVKTSPGVFELLMGPSGTGPIYARDSTFATFSDNGSAYSSYAAFGNIVFAHHGQMAGLIHVGADFPKVGTPPTLSILLDEILHNANTPPWVPVPYPVNDPPNLPASNSIYQLRYWMLQSQQPTYCRTGLFKFDFGSMDTVKNELLLWTVFGSSETEEG